MAIGAVNFMRWLFHERSIRRRATLHSVFRTMNTPLTIGGADRGCSWWRS